MQQHLLDKIMDEQDRDFVRVLEDLIDVLIAQGVITMDMMPRDAAEKLEHRRKVRGLYERTPRSPDIDLIDTKLSRFGLGN